MFQGKCPNIIFAFLIIIAFYSFEIKAFNLKLTKIKCNVTDRSFAKFETCRVKAESRYLQYFQIYLKYLQLPITSDIRAHFQFFKRANGYKPFLYNFVFRCDFLRHLNPVTTILWRWFTTVSNLNHSCPFTEDFVIKRLENRFLEKELGVLPVASGDYLFVATLDTVNVTRLFIEFYATIY